MRTSLYSLCIFFLLSLLGGCQSSRDEIKDKIGNMMAKPVTIPYSKMLLWTKDSIPPKNPHILCDFKLVVYMDSTHCTECTLKGMHLWNDFYKLEHKYEGRFKVVFIVQTSKKSNAQIIASAFQHYGVEYPMYIDSTNVFSSMNPHIPSEDMYHVFLIDKKDSVVLVGNPQFNEKIEKRLLEILENSK